MPGEPGGAGLPAALAAVLPPSGSAPARASTPTGIWTGPSTTAPSSPVATLSRLREPPGPRLGPEAIASAEIVLVPALAVDATGTRLGRGGGSYDRALARVRPEVPVIALLYPGELVPLLPAEPHDRPVTAVLTPRLGSQSALGELGRSPPPGWSRPDSGRTAAGAPPLALEVSECQASPLTPPTIPARSRRRTCPPTSTPAPPVGTSSRRCSPSRTPRSPRARSATVGCARCSRPWGSSSRARASTAPTLGRMRRRVRVPRSRQPRVPRSPTAPPPRRRRLVRPRRPRRRRRRTASARLERSSPRSTSSSGSTGSTSGNGLDAPDRRSASGSSSGSAKAACVGLLARYRGGTY